MKNSLTKIKNNFGGDVKMKKSLTKIKIDFGSGKMKKIVLVLVLLAIPVAIVFAQTVSHQASQIISGTFQAGNFVFQDNVIVQDDLTVDTNTLHVDSTSNRVGIGTTNPGEKLEVAGNINVSGTSDICITGGNCLSTAGGTLTFAQIESGTATDKTFTVGSGGTLAIGSGGILNASSGRLTIPISAPSTPQVGDMWIVTS